MKSAHLLLHVGKSGVCSAAAGRPGVVCRVVSGILGAPRTGARAGAAPVELRLRGRAPEPPGGGFLHCSEIGKTGLCEALP